MKGPYTSAVHLTLEAMNDFFCLFDCVATNVAGGQIWTVGNASHPEIDRAWTKLNLDQLATNKIVRLKPSTKPGNLPLIWEVSSETQPDSFGQAVRDNCATKIAMDTRLEPGVNIEPGMVEEFGQPIEELQWSNPERLLTDKHLLESAEVLMAHLKQNGEINEAAQAILLRWMSLLR